MFRGLANRDGLKQTGSARVAYADAGNPARAWNGVGVDVV